MFTFMDLRLTDFANALFGPMSYSVTEVFCLSVYHFFSSVLCQAEIGLMSVFFSLEGFSETFKIVN